jgi:hypothetical protein
MTELGESSLRQKTHCKAVSGTYLLSSSTLLHTPLRLSSFQLPLPLPPLTLLSHDSPLTPPTVASRKKSKLRDPPPPPASLPSSAMADSPPAPSWSISTMANSAVQFLRLPVLASSGLAVVASGLLYFKQKYGPPVLGSVRGN